MGDTQEHKAECFFCGQMFHFGNHKYHGRRLKHFQVMACDGCLQGNWDGLADEETIEKLFAHLDEMGIPKPERNAKGWVDLK